MDKTAYKRFHIQMSESVSIQMVFFILYSYLVLNKSFFCTVMIFSVFQNDEPKASCKAKGIITCKSDSTYLLNFQNSCNKSKLLWSGAGKRHMESSSLWRLSKLAGRKLFKFQLLIIALSATLVLVFDFQSQLK